MRRSIGYEYFYMRQFFILLCWLLSGGIVAQTTGLSQKDSLRQAITGVEGQEKLDAYMRLTNIYYAEARDKLKRDTLFALYDAMDAEAERQGNDSRRAVVMANRLQVLNTATEFDEVIRRAPGFLAFAEGKAFWNIYYNLYNPLINAHRGKGDEDKAMAVAKEMLEHAKKRQNHSGMGLAFYNMASIYSGQRRFKEQEECLRECIILIKDSTAMLNILPTAYVRLSNCLIAQKRYDEAIRVMDESEAVIRRYEEASRSRQPNAWLNLYMTYLDAYRQSGQIDMAEVYIKKIDSFSNGTIPLYEERAAIFMGRKQYAQALEMADKAIETARTEAKLQHLGMKMMILTGMGDVEAAQLQFREIVAEMDARHNEKMNAQLDEIRTQYEVDKIKAEKERIRNYLLFALGGCLLLTVILSIYIYYSRLIQKKNRGLYLQIKEQDRLAEEMRQLIVETGRAPSPPPEIASANRKQKILVNQLQEYLLKNNRFAQTDFDRDDLVAALGTNKTYLFEAVKLVTGKSLQEYVNHLRLEEARHLIDLHPELTIEAIALDSGFNTTRTFYRLFRELYKISPADYRKAGSNPD